MSELIAVAAIRGAHKILKQAQEKLKAAIEAKGPHAAVEFPNTGYYIPVAYSLLGVPVQRLTDFEPVLDECRRLLPAVAGKPSLDHALDAGMAALLAEEIIEACKYLIGPNPAGGLWLGAADDVKLRERGLEFVDGSVSGFAAVIGAAPDAESAAQIARKLQEKNLFVFMCGHSRGISFAGQLAESGVQTGWETRLVPFGKDISAAAYALGFAARVALSFGGVQAGDAGRMLYYVRMHMPAFVMALGGIDDEKAATAAGALKFGFTVVADTDVQEIRPASADSYEQIIANVPQDKIVDRCIEARGIKIKVTEIPIPVPYSPAFEGERVRRENMQVEFGSARADGFELVVMKESADEVEDARVEVIGPELGDLDKGGTNAFAIIAEIYGRKMQKDFEPVLERQIHRFLNEAQGVFHVGQRDIVWLRISEEAFNAGFRLAHLGTLLHAKFHDEYGAILDKVQVKIYTEADKVAELLAEARAAYRERDRRLADMTDESVDTFYSCTLCQSFAPTHVCIITPERPGLCGAYNWLDGRAAYEITPSGPNQPVEKGKPIDERLGQWEGVNRVVYEKSGKAVERLSAYSMIVDPMTSCGCFECISATLPATNGIMTVDRDYTEMTPCGMKFSTLAGSVGGGNVTPGFIGHSKLYIGSRKFISAEGGLARLTWMPRHLKEELKEMINARASEMGLGRNFTGKIADETIAQTEEEVVAFAQRVKHPALAMEPMF
ncbi:MAG: CO dehydrogenase/CO-methylating acetyl-CoA synthase complex subunit beta [Planctomycetota bacterium]|nr:MAG: CO dehydrogenase/CO-methylating acetyl-CoA synthase complex subunit beta [Planctomycetota bacterium]